MRLSLNCCLLAATALCQTVQKPLNNISLGNLSPPSWRDRLLTLHRELIEIESISGNEYRLGEYLIDYLSGRGYTLDYQTLNPTTDKPRRFNVLAWSVPPGKEASKPRVLVSSHMDVVPPYIPYSIEEGPITPKTRISGRGSVDAKASVAAQIIAVEELLAEGKVNGKDLMLLFVVGEETSGDGMKWFSSHMDELSPTPKFEAAIFGEPTENKLACGHKGALHCVLGAKGRAGHSGYPWLGKSANELMVRALSAMLAVDLGSSDEFGNTTINIGLLNGGVAGNVIPENSTADLMLRVAIGPEATGAKIVEDKIRKIISDIDSEAFTFECNQGYGFVKTDCGVKGFETITVNYGTDVPGLKGDHTRYLYGPGSILVAHSAQENLTVGDLEIAVEGYKKLILHALDASSEL